MKDTIDERNFKEKCARSVIKSYNVRFVTPEPKPEENAQKAEGEEPAFEADERYAHMPSAQYGTTSVEDPLTKEQIEKILGERQEKLFDSMKELQ